MKNSILIFFLILVSCTAKNIHSQATKSESKTLYEVYAIDSINNYYLIYAKKNDTLFKIVSKKQNDLKCKSISIGRFYPFSLKSNSSLAPIINGVKIAPLNVDCYQFDINTKICTEKHNGIYELYLPENISGLCMSIEKK